jgi:predicted transcriptional regulator
MPTGNSLYQRKPGRLAGEKKKFRTLVEKLQKLAAEEGYTKKQIASEVGVSLVAVSQWWSGYTLTGKRETIEKLKKFLAEERSS